MLQNQCISVTDLRKNTKDCLKNLSSGEKFVFINNKPVAVILSLDAYEEFFPITMLQPLNATEVTEKISKKAAKARLMHSSKFVNI
jgi:PHD/YefM family antitoxin component YafN of YafNO toxin-antitoxin module